MVLKVGKETEDDKDKPAVYAQRSDKDLLFLLPGDLARGLREVNLHDRAGVINAQPAMDVALVGLGAPVPKTSFWLVRPSSPIRCNISKRPRSRNYRLAIRTREELRVLAFQRDPKAKDKDWHDLSGLQEFTVDSQKVNKFIEELATLKAGRWVSLAGGIKSEQKLTAKDAMLRIGLVLEDGTIITLTVGAEFERLGFYAQSSAMPEAVFMLAASQVEPLLQGPRYFGKDRVAGGP